MSDSDIEVLRRRFRRFAFPMTAAFLAWYLLYVLLSAYARDLMGVRVFGNVNVALLLGIGQFASTFGIAAWYAAYARRRLDPLADRLRTAADHRTAGAADTGPAGATSGAGASDSAGEATR
ncbi:hypothetical protein GCM10010124_32220 [Pilimelia terevasa]|uniref:DUF485 domain-containing protein n=1 Tax=Pilimelia terevasa TaxID=53372 RepID=A0A8J3FK63_9ACTN|nr:DUF485 domain-containing protein [Pilimelia terevasa]GGK37092.1 hypothetical protein GCM10010124_32220 [Pilimelia terevasa]